MRPLICVESILIPVKSAGIQANATAILADGYSLGADTEGILHVNVVQLEVILVNANSTTCIIGSSLASWNTSLDSNLITFVCCCVGCVAINLD